MSVENDVTSNGSMTWFRRKLATKPKSLHSMPNPCSTEERTSYDDVQPAKKQPLMQKVSGSDDDDSNEEDEEGDEFEEVEKDEDVIQTMPIRSDENANPVHEMSQLTYASYN
ncbi:hypothetical protein COOONC_07421 [Cooperia oncophora]